MKLKRTPTWRLAETYLLIIMLMSLGFSVVFYRTSSHELGRQLPPDSLFHHSTTVDPTAGQVSMPAAKGADDSGQSKDVDDFLQQRITEGRKALLTKLIALNIGALVVGSYVSYVLARRTLAPIEEAMEAQTQFVSDAAHELRTPLTAIQASNEVALRRPKLSLAESREVIAQNTEDIKRLKALSDGLLSLAQRSNTDAIIGPVALQDVVGEAMVQVVMQATEKDVAVEDKAAAVEVLADANTLQQALVILLDNAVKYSDRGGTVYLESETKGKQALLHVRDEGIGIRASDMPHVFRRFYRADNARTSGGERHGYGLGLAIAQQIIEAQHGAISVQSEPGKGSIFTIKLPQA